MSFEKRPMGGKAYSSGGGAAGGWTRKKRARKPSRRLRSLLPWPACSVYYCTYIQYVPSRAKMSNRGDGPFNTKKSGKKPRRPGVATKTRKAREWIQRNKERNCFVSPARIQLLPLMQMTERYLNCSPSCSPPSSPPSRWIRPRLKIFLRF
jgi:hypothetical protein